MNSVNTLLICFLHWCDCKNGIWKSHLYWITFGHWKYLMFSDKYHFLSKITAPILASVFNYLGLLVQSLFLPFRNLLLCSTRINPQFFCSILRFLTFFSSVTLHRFPRPFSLTSQLHHRLPPLFLETWNLLPFNPICAKFHPIQSSCNFVRKKPRQHRKQNGVCWFEGSTESQMKKRFLDQTRKKKKKYRHAFIFILSILTVRFIFFIFVSFFVYIINSIFFVSFQLFRSFFSFLYSSLYLIYFYS